MAESYTEAQMHKAVADLEAQLDFLQSKGFTGESSYESDFGALYAYIKALQLRVADHAIRAACRDTPPPIHPAIRVLVEREIAVIRAMGGDTTQAVGLETALAGTVAPEHDTNDRNLPNYSTSIVFSLEHYAFVATSAEFPGLSGVAKTRHDALRALLAAMMKACTEAIADGKELPLQLALAGAVKGGAHG